MCELSDILEISQPNISKNLSKLRDQDLVSSEKNDKFVLYKLKTGNDVLKREVNDILENLENYPQLMADQKRKSDNEKLLAPCCMRVKKKTIE
ncbi:transcriptional regulator ArsR family [Acetobacterium woodii DSM 1030]|uniref:Transcriptional regulator ArsR family n=1 Tax=Acetobacterium woodii (strain ATCC 29683 / DSM 1030 / JCM 2381 / KCTC 1655 / WB1) TaxID=931626 RepID=H6LC74_ACEWD|nr:transcriptional regulator ArsR family [Acetobacterium woodii DSM 1030]